MEFCPCYLPNMLWKAKHKVIPHISLNHCFHFLRLPTINLCHTGRGILFVCYCLADTFSMLHWPFTWVTLQFIAWEQWKYKCALCVFMTNFESKICTGCGVWDILTDCTWSLYSVKKEVLGLNCDVHTAGAAGMSLVIQYLCPLYFFF